MRTKVNVLTHGQEMLVDAREGHAGSPEEPALMTSAEHLGERLATHILSKNNLCSGFTVQHGLYWSLKNREIHLLYLLVLNILFSNEDA